MDIVTFQAVADPISCVACAVADPADWAMRLWRLHCTSPVCTPAAQVSTELIRMAILWHEMWHEALEEASRQYFGESNVEAMLATLLPLHEMMARSGPTTLKEIAFVQVRSHACVI